MNAEGKKIDSGLTGSLENRIMRSRGLVMKRAIGIAVLLLVAAGVWMTADAGLPGTPRLKKIAAKRNHLDDDSTLTLTIQYTQGGLLLTWQARPGIGHWAVLRDLDGAMFEPETLTVTSDTFLLETETLGR